MTTTLREITFSFAVRSGTPNRAGAQDLLLLFRFDVGDCVPYGRDLLGVFVRNFQLERFFECHDQLNDIQRIGAEIVDEGSLVVHLALVHTELFDNNLFDLLLYGRCHNFLHYNLRKVLILHYTQLRANFVLPRATI